MSKGWILFFQRLNEIRCRREDGTMEARHGGDGKGGGVLHGDGRRLLLGHFSIVSLFGPPGAAGWGTLEVTHYPDCPVKMGHVSGREGDGQA